MKTVGIIGGLGPETTAEFYLALVFGCYQQNKANRPPILIWNIPLEYKIEEDLLTKATGEERYIPYLVDAAKCLEKGGADFLVMPCNSCHIFIQQIRDAVRIPVLSITEETAKFLLDMGVSKVGMLSTTTTINRKLYENILGKNGIQQFVPDEEDQVNIGKMINDIVLNRHNEKDREELLRIISKFEKAGVNDVVLACTDLQLLKPEHIRVKIYDTMKIFASATIREVLATRT